MAVPVPGRSVLISAFLVYALLHQISLLVIRDRVGRVS
jgi:hypothetical protein